MTSESSGPNESRPKSDPTDDDIESTMKRRAAIRKRDLFADFGLY